MEEDEKLAAVRYIALTIEDETDKLPIEFLNLIQDKKTFAQNVIKCWDIKWLRRKYGYTQKEIFSMLSDDSYHEDDSLIGFSKTDICSYSDLSHIILETDKSLDEILDIAAEFCEPAAWEALLRYCAKYYPDIMRASRLKTVLLDLDDIDKKIALVNKVVETRQMLYPNNKKSLEKIAYNYFSDDYMRMIDFLMHSRRYSAFDDIIEVRYARSGYPYIYSWDDINDIPLLSDLSSEEIDKIIKESVSAS